MAPPNGQVMQLPQPGYGSQQRQKEQGEGSSALSYNRPPKMETMVDWAAVNYIVPQLGCSDGLMFQNVAAFGPSFGTDWNATTSPPLTKRIRVDSHGSSAAGSPGHSRYSPRHEGLSTVRQLGSTSMETSAQKPGHGKSRQVNKQDINETLQRLHSSASRPSSDPKRQSPGIAGPDCAPPPRVLEESWPLQGISAKGVGTLGGANDANCMEKLLVHCAAALEIKDVTLAQQIMWVLNNFADPDGDTNQRVTYYFLRALVNRAAKMGSNLLGRLPAAPTLNKFLSPNELAGHVDVTPWYRFGYCAANGVMIDAFEGKDRVHIIDFSTTHCMQWPTLIQALADRPEGPPYIRLTVHHSETQVPPILNVSYDELGDRLRKFARMKNVPLEFHVITGEAENLVPAMMGLRQGEAVAVNCLARLHCFTDESADSSSPRDIILRMIRSLQPVIVTLVEEDSNLSVPSLVSRLKVAFNYMWIPFDALDTLLARNSIQRLQYEGDIAYRIDNVIACEGLDRTERMESKEKWVLRMRRAGFKPTPFSQNVVSEVKQMLDEHAAGWGHKEEEECLLLTWKGHNVVFATAWVPATLPP